MKAIIFDLDGLLINSEPLWHKAEKLVFGSVGLPLKTKQCLETTGLRVDDVVKYRYERDPWEGKSLEQVEHEIVDEVIRLINTEGKAMPGVTEVLDFFKKKELPLAVASSSPMRIITTALARLGITDIFKVIHSAEGEAYAKPHPAVYLSTAKMLDISPTDCLAFEDSMNGLIAAKAARMTAVAVPEMRTVRFECADLVLDSLLEFSEDLWGMIQ